MLLSFCSKLAGSLLIWCLWYFSYIQVLTATDQTSIAEFFNIKLAQKVSMSRLLEYRSTFQRVLRTKTSSNISRELLEVWWRDWWCRSKLQGIRILHFWSKVMGIQTAECGELKKKYRSKLLKFVMFSMIFSRMLSLCFHYKLCFDWFERVGEFGEKAWRSSEAVPVI